MLAHATSVSSSRGYCVAAVRAWCRSIGTATMKKGIQGPVMMRYICVLGFLIPALPAFTAESDIGGRLSGTWVLDEAQKKRLGPGVNIGDRLTFEKNENLPRDMPLDHKILRGKPVRFAGVLTFGKGGHKHSWFVLVAEIGGHRLIPFSEYNGPRFEIGATFEVMIVEAVKAEDDYLLIRPAHPRPFFPWTAYNRAPPAADNQKAP